MVTIGESSGRANSTSSTLRFAMCHVDVEMLRDAGDLGPHRNFAQDVVHHAAFFHAFGRAMDDDRHVDRDFLVRVDLLEVDVEQRAVGRVALQGLDHALGRLAADIEVDDRAVALDPFEGAGEVVGVQCQHLRRVAMSVDHCRDAAAPPHLAYFAFARFGPGFGLDFVCHSTSLGLV
jgi:hypothetical protein